MARSRSQTKSRSPQRKKSPQKNRLPGSRIAGGATIKQLIRAVEFRSFTKVSTSIGSVSLNNLREVWGAWIGKTYVMTQAEFNELKRLTFEFGKNESALDVLYEKSTAPAANPTEDDLKRAQALKANLVELHTQITAFVAHVQSRPKQVQLFDDPEEKVGNVDWLYRITDMYVTKHGDKKVTPSDFVANVHNACIHGKLEEDDCQFFRDQLSNFGKTTAEQKLNFAKYLARICGMGKSNPKFQKVINLFTLPYLVGHQLW